MWLEQKYIGMLSGRLDRFKRINRTTFNFRCPICGDSQKNLSKARGFIFAKNDGGFLYHCHNCNITLDLDALIKKLDPFLHAEYIKEKLVDKYSGDRKKTDVEVFADKMKKPNFVKYTFLNNLKKISQLEYNHPAKKYIADRKIPNKYHSKLFYAPKFKQFVNMVHPYKFGKNDERDEPRLIIPFLDENKNLLGFQGRSFNPNAALRYITIMLDEKHPKIFNLDECNRSKTHYIFEGPIDSMFVENSIAMAGGSIDWTFVNENSVFVYDNEPRSKETIKKITKVIDKDYKVVLFPESIHQKDINDMILQNENIDISKILSQNISSGLEAKVILTAWRRV